jgi:hypothetical protein
MQPRSNLGSKPSRVRCRVAGRFGPGVSPPCDRMNADTSCPLVRRSFKARPSHGRYLIVNLGGADATKTRRQPVLHGLGRAVDLRNPCRENKEKLTAEKGNAHDLRRPGTESRYPGSRGGQAQGRAGHSQWEAVSLVEGNCGELRRRPRLRGSHETGTPVA